MIDHPHQTVSAPPADTPRIPRIGAVAGQSDRLAMALLLGCFSAFCGGALAWAASAEAGWFAAAVGLGFLLALGLGWWGWSHQRPVRAGYGATLVAMGAGLLVFKLAVAAAEVGRARLGALATAPLAVGLILIGVHWLRDRGVTDGRHDR